MFSKSRHIFAFKICSNFRSCSSLDKLPKILSNAEQIVGYNTSFLSFKSLFSDEVSNIALNLKNVLDRKHPLFKATKNILYGEYNIIQIHGLIILLISKLFGFSPTHNLFTPAEIDQGITQKQRSLSEIAQIIYMAKLIQRGITEFSQGDTIDKSVTAGNNLAILSGDYLLASACNDLANLENTQVVEEMSQAIADQMIDEYRMYDYHTKEDPSQDHDSSDHSTSINTEPSTAGQTYSLLAYSASSVLRLVNHSEGSRDLAFKFGHFIGQALEIYTNHKNDEDSATGQKCLGECLKKLDYSLELLSPFPESDSKRALHDVIKSYQSLVKQSQKQMAENR